MGARARVPLYGIDQWYKLFTPCQLLALGVFAKHTRGAREALLGAGYSDEWSEAVAAYLGLMLDRLANQGSTISQWNVGGETIGGSHGTR